MIILGVDPGIRNTGIAVLDGGKAVYRTTVCPQQRTKLIPSEVIRCLVPVLSAVLTKYTPSATVVEEVTWYGRARRAMLPLALVAGAIVGISIARNVDTYLLLASMRDKTKTWPASWTEHERDAAALAMRLHLWFAADAKDRSDLSRRSLAATLTSTTESALRKRS